MFYNTITVRAHGTDDSRDSLVRIADSELTNVHPSQFFHRTFRYELVRTESMMLPNLYLYCEGDMPDLLTNPSLNDVPMRITHDLTISSQEG